MQQDPRKVDRLSTFAADNLHAVVEKGGYTTSDSVTQGDATLSRTDSSSRCGFLHPSAGGVSLDDLESSMVYLSSIRKR